MSKIIHCELCGVDTGCKPLGRPRKYCIQCTFQKEYDTRVAYHEKNYKKIMLDAARYREANREKIREQSRIHHAIKAKEKKLYEQKLLDDIIANPRKYLKMVVRKNDG